MSILKSILEKMSSVSKPQYTFIIILFTTLMYLPGKANFRNLSRYSDLHEKTGPVNFPVIAYEFEASRKFVESLAASMGNQKRSH
jgi:hypothetical protein